MHGHTHTHTHTHTASLSLQVFAVETVYTVGICIFAFRVLPLVDDVLQALCIMAGIAFWPAVLNVFNRFNSHLFHHLLQYI